MNASPMADFAEGLYLDGRAVIESWQPVTDTDLDATAKILIQSHALAATDAPGQAPELDLESALWATTALHWAIGTFVNRSEVETDLPSHLQARQPGDANASIQWSVDLAFRFLPSLIRRSHLIAQDDGLSKTLVALANRWPLCLAELDDDLIKDPPVERLEAVAADACLRRVMIDRVFRHKSRWLATNELFAAVLREAAGLHTSVSEWLRQVQATGYQSSNKPA